MPNMWPQGSCLSPHLWSPFGAKILKNCVLEHVPEPVGVRGSPKMVPKWPKAAKMTQSGAPNHRLSVDFLPFCEGFCT